MAEGHLVIVGAKTALSQSMRAQIASLGLFDQVIFVTRYSRALPQSERELIGSITTLAATARVLALVYAGERPAEEDLAKVHKYVLTQMHKNGYADSRLAEGGFWFVDGGSGPFVVSSPAELLTIPHEKIEAARSETLRREAGDLLGKIAAQAETGEAKTLPPLTEEEVQKEEDHLRKALHDAYQRAELRLQGEPNPTDEQVRAAVLDAILQWGSHVGLEGIWLQFMEKVRPGSEAGLFNEAREAARELSIIARRISPQPGALAPKEGRRGLTNIKTQALRGGVAMAGGLIAYGAANLFDASRGEATFALLAGACVCFAVGEYLIKPAAALPEPREEAKETPTRGPAPGPFDGGRIGNYSAFAERLRAWFAGHVRVSTLNVAAQCRALGERLQPGTGGAL
ncbi:MAG TPA: hypothetical protein VGO11_08990 [Chthoniobacteraceae bacterium]|nr:hypothetical protein [Chthoniobacteraceae bacterium]